MDRTSLIEALYADKLFELGNQLQEGQAGPEAAGLSAKFYQAAAERGHVDAMYELGLCYRWGEGGVYAEPDLAIEWFRKAADQGHEKAAALVRQFDSPSGRHTLLFSAVSGAEGFGSKWYKSKMMVDEYYAKADAGDAESQYELARQLSETDNPGPFRRDPPKAAHYYTLAAQNGVVDAMFNLAMLYENGAPGVPVDREMAKKWYARCAETGDAEARDILRKRFS